MDVLTLRRSSLPIAALISAFASCSGKAGIGTTGDELGTGGTGGTGASGGSAGLTSSGGDSASGTGGASGAAGSGKAPPIIDVGDGGTPVECVPTTCAELGFACGYLVDACNNMVNCADEGLSCGPLEACTGGVDGPTQCESSLGGEPCGLCSGVKDCSAATQLTRLTGRVVTPGRDDANVANQVGVPNAFVYILRDNDATKLPPIAAGIPSGGTSCDRCEDQDLGPVLAGTVTDATGHYTLEGNIPVGMEFVLVVKAGRFRRAVPYTLPETAACVTTELPSTLPDNPTRLPRSMDDGVAANIPRIAVSTGEVDAMECVLEKMGIAHTEFGNPGDAGDAAARVHLYRGRPTGMMGGGFGGMGAGGGGGTAGGASMGKGTGARIDDATPLDTALYTDPARLQSYDIVLADCEGSTYDSNASERVAHGAKVMEYVNRGGRLFASHLSFTWLEDNGTQAYDPAMELTTGLGPAATWRTMVDSMSTEGIGTISIGRPQASPRVQNFADWMVSEAVTTAPDYTFMIKEPRTQNAAISEASEEFVYEPARERIQQFSFNTPYAGPATAACGRVAYSGFHVSLGNTNAAIFPAHCIATPDLTPQEKVLLYMLFDLSACVGEPPVPPECTPTTCEEVGAECGFVGDGCGDVLDCGPCSVPPPR